MFRVCLFLFSDYYSLLLDSVSECCAFSLLMGASCSLCDVPIGLFNVSRCINLWYPSALPFLVNPVVPTAAILDVARATTTTTTGTCIMSAILTLFCSWSDSAKMMSKHMGSTTGGTYINYYLFENATNCCCIAGRPGSSEVTM